MLIALRLKEYFLERAKKESLVVAKALDGVDENVIIDEWKMVLEDDDRFFQGEDAVLTFRIYYCQCLSQHIHCYILLTFSQLSTADDYGYIKSQRFLALTFLHISGDGGIRTHVPLRTT